jgi:hypothetical protein
MINCDHEGSLLTGRLSEVRDREGKYQTVASTIDHYSRINGTHSMR